MEILPIFLIVFIILFLLLLLIYSIYVRLPLEFRYEDRPNLVFLYLRALRVGLKRKNLVVADSEVYSQFKRIEIIAKDCRIDPYNLKQYKEICGYEEGDSIPACYMESYFIPLIIILITCDEFNLSPLGLIHIGQTITQHKSLEHLHHEPFDMEMVLTQHKHTDKGIQLLFLMKIFDRREMCIWEGTATMLSRNEKTKQSGKSHKPTNDHLQTDLIRKNEVLIEKIPHYLGRQFARITGDLNPHHLFGWSARLFGYKQPIAHGMWTMARTIAHLQTSGIFPVKPPFQVGVDFKRPVFMPSTSVFTYVAQANKDMYRFKVEDEHTQVPQLTGFIQQL